MINVESLRARDQENTLNWNNIDIGGNSLDLSFAYDLLRPSARSCLCAGAQSFLSALIHFFAFVVTFNLDFISFSLVCTSYALLLDSVCALAYNHYSFIIRFFLLLSMLLSLLCFAPVFWLCASTQPSMRTSSIYILWFIYQYLLEFCS